MINVGLLLFNKMKEVACKEVVFLTEFSDAAGRQTDPLLDDEKFAGCAL